MNKLKSLFLPISFSVDFPSVKCFISTRPCGNAKLLIVRKAIALACGVDYKKLTNCTQVHGNKIDVVNIKRIGTELPGSDGLLTRLSRIPIAVLTADCLPVFLYEPVTGVIGLVHAGKSGTESGIISEAIKKMSSVYMSKPDNVYAVLGPCICGKCYGYDMISENIRQLKDVGVKKNNINPAGLCTYEDGRFFSYRRDNKTEERMMSLIVKV